MSNVTLTGRGGVELTLHAPHGVPGGLEARAFTLTAPLARPRILQHEKKKYRVPACEAGFFIATITILEVS